MNLICVLLFFSFLMTMPCPVSGVGFGRILHKIHTARKNNSGVVYKRSGGTLEHPNHYEMNPFLFWNCYFSIKNVSWSMFLENSVHVYSCAKMPQKFDCKKRLSSSVQCVEHDEQNLFCDQNFWFRNHTSSILVFCSQYEVMPFISVNIPFISVSMIDSAI